MTTVLLWLTVNDAVYLFFTEFSTQIPLFHRKMEPTHPILMTAMRACGALFAKTSTAANFIITTLTSSRDMLLLEFVCLWWLHPTDFLIDALRFPLMSVQAELHPERPNLSNARRGTTSIDRTLAVSTGTKIIVEDVPWTSRYGPFLLYFFH